jgi:hypothetical protein
MANRPSYLPTDILHFVLTSVGFSEPYPRPTEPPVTLATEVPKKRRVRFELSVSEFRDAVEERDEFCVELQDHDIIIYALNTSPICVFFRRNAGVMVCRVDSADPACEVVRRNGKIMARVRRNPPAVVKTVL